MADLSSVNEQALHLVAKELATTLNDVRVALEASAEKPEDPAPVSRTIDLLHQANGVLRVVEVYGAALMAEEMELTARWLAAGPHDLRQHEDGLDALMRAGVQLPVFLERVLGGGRDLALVVLPLLNDLRAVRGAPLLSEGTLLSLNLSSDHMPQAGAQKPGEPKLSVPQWARRLRPKFQTALLAWIRNGGEQEVVALAEVADRLETVARSTAVHQLWWVVGAVLDALRAGGIASSVTLKRLLGQADRELKRLYQHGEEAYAKAPPLELLNNLLFYVARAEPSSERLKAVRASFRLDELLPLDASVEQERESLSMPSAKLMRTVGAAIKEDLGRVKDALDLHTRRNGPPADLAPQVELLKKIGDTLGVLGLGSMREQVQGELARLDEMIANGPPTGQDTLIEIAAALIGIEDGLDDALMRLIMPPGAPAAGAETDPELRQVTEAVLRECMVNLARIKELLGKSLEADWDLTGADQVPQLMRGITAGLLMLGRNRAMEIMRRIGGHVVAAMGPGHLPMPEERLERLADAIVAVEYYMETLQAGRGDPWYMLDNAERCLAAVESESPPQAALPEAAAPEETVVAASGAHWALPEATLPATAPAAPAAAAPAEPADPELLGLFIEEAREAIGLVRELFPMWEENAPDRESLARVRRAFHTLKGSGRMVGAHRVGDFAWSIESLLNRVIDGTLERSAGMMRTLRSAIELLPGLVNELEGGELATGVEEVRAQASALTEGREYPALPPAPAFPQPAVAVPSPAHEPTVVLPAPDERVIRRMLEQVPPAGGAPPAAPTEPDPWQGRPESYAEEGDAALDDIYRKEVQSHLEVLRAYLREAWLAPGPHLVTDELYRACHTLRGASRAAGIRHSVRLADPLHRWLHQMFDHDCSFDEIGLAVLADAVVGFEDIIEAVHDSTGRFTHIDRLIQRIDERDAALQREVAEARPSAGAEPQPVEAAPEQAPEPPPEPAPEPAPPGPLPEPPLGLEALVPGIVVESMVPERDVHGLVPAAPDPTGVEGLPPYLQEPAAQVPAAETPSPPTAAEPAAAEPTPASAAEPPAAAAEDYDHDIAAIFSEEATELLEAADSALGALRSERGEHEQVVELQRALHTLKGGARMAGIMTMGDLSHELEALLVHVDDGSVSLDERSFEVLQSSLDELNRMRDFVSSGRRVEPARDLITRIRMIGRRQVEMPPAPPTREAGAPVVRSPPVMPPPPVAPPEPPARDELPVEAEERAADAGRAVPPGREVAERADVARVDAELLDTMLNAAGEVSIFRARLEQQLSSVEYNLAELGRVVQRLKDQLRKLEIETEAQILHRHVDQAPRRDDFDPLELDRYSTIQQYSRALAETSSDVASLQGLLESMAREAQNLLTQQGRIVTELQGGLMRTRMVPFRRHVQRLTRVVRQAAAESGKKAELVVTGAAGEVDRQVLERMLPPFEHLLRNAVIHGIELPEARVAVGKPEAGRIELTLRREGSEVVITVVDDGAGVNLKAVRDRAIALGLTTPKHDLTDDQALQLILEPGFSTAGRVTQSAGRGVGMDVVATEVKKLGGSLYTETEPGRGTRFTARLPFTLAISQALVVRVGEELFALPLPTVEGVVRVPRNEVQRHLAEEAASFDYGGQHYRVQHLASLIGGIGAPAAEQDLAVPVILVRAGEQSSAIVTDELVGSREIVVKAVGPQVSGIRGISGATILGDGRICVILDIGALVRSEWRRAAPDVPAASQADRRVFALVVDDSITVRRVTQRLLERNGMRVATAKDGLDAIAVLQAEVPDVILLDIEMPRMDGYEVASHVRNDPRLKHVPIVMITSRVGEKHRARAIELGVNEYLGKPYQEGALLQAIEPLVRPEAR